MVDKNIKILALIDLNKNERYMFTRIISPFSITASLCVGGGGVNVFGLLHGNLITQKTTSNKGSDYNDNDNRRVTRTQMDCSVEWR